ncbi:hypothetical protein [Parafrankia elaeagni]|uniref:hypothetical protein n=1 Tax=Parafrankia elaeagni TaxID=222534 RepID=UPI0012B572F9|nr:hypothetical protein [Parafrankia elaeagni]
MRRPRPAASHRGRRYGAHVWLRILFATDPGNEHPPRRRVEAALATGQLRGPDGTPTRWDCATAALADETRPVPARHNIAAWDVVPLLDRGAEGAPHRDPAAGRERAEPGRDLVAALDGAGLGTLVAAVAEPTAIHELVGAGRRLQIPTFLHRHVRRT